MMWGIRTQKRVCKHMSSKQGHESCFGRKDMHIAEQKHKAHKDRAMLTPDRFNTDGSVLFVSCIESFPVCL